MARQSAHELHADRVSSLFPFASRPWLSLFLAMSRV
jgi:hypothetical protein